MRPPPSLILKQPVGRLRLENRDRRKDAACLLERRLEESQDLAQEEWQRTDL